MVSAVNINLETAFHKISRKPMSLKIIGFNALPTMVERDTIEYSNPYGIENLELVFTELGYTTHTKVDSRIGMVTPRIIAMIINEAFYTVQEGTATEKDIDTAMKLGVNYPKGPFEFLEKIGVEYVYRILEAIYEDTKEERYKICPALKKAYLNL
jgi:3-hydroxybutyryl-CoA dehydrogenase